MGEGEGSLSRKELGLPEDETLLEQQQSKPEVKELQTNFPYKGIIVFGHGFRGEREGLSVEARIRVLAAYQLFKDGVADRIIVTGGMASENDKAKFGDSLTSNGEMMRDYLVNDLGVPEEKVVFENQSTKTVDNVGHALNALNEEKKAKEEAENAGEENYVTVSTGYHMRRIAEIMKKFNIKSAAVSAEWGLQSRAKEHAEKMRQRELTLGVPIEKVDQNYNIRLTRYDRLINKMSLKDPSMVSELKNEDKWLDAMKQWGYWGPLALAVKGEKLREIVENNRSDIEEWLQRHSDLGVTIDDLIEGNFEYMDLVNKGREVPS